MASMQDLSAISVNILKFRLSAKNLENNTAIFELRSGRSEGWLSDVVVPYSDTPFEFMRLGSSLSVQQFLDCLRLP